MDETWLDPDTQVEWAVSKSKKSMPFAEIATYIGQLNSERYAGHDDWRCPEVKELIALIDFGSTGPAVRREVPFRDGDAYWSATPSAKNADMAWYVDYHFGFNHFSVKATEYSVRCVRGGTGQMNRNNGDRIPVVQKI